ncbi:SDR family oxidoreductase [Pseudofrankia inefficax]|uniref:Short-chain dehydrogenase/reductase SDR n=1 Tax=Pseudofrankia inefficax (strain DSM 45817 / CECT 9037 / DDB 130130 / EuI1c) TaxID=298654 RepID=E3IXW8_PSEI1|nr:SDR family oxidoreductase [Pseudofrankia inefficax]ADP81423.1 short-chain dehydrogenase/reductase SDR [Pseudofrankia inefficax]
MSEPKEQAAGVVAISGAGTGIGQATAQKFGELGWRVVVGGRRAEKLAETVALVEKAGGECLAHPLDVTDAESVDRFFDAAEERFGTVTAVINNAATGRYGPLESFSPEEIHTEIATKLVGGLYMARRGVRALLAAEKPGDILFITSLSAGTQWLHHLPYAAANAGVEHAARILRLELEGTGIRVTALRCGDTLGTDFNTVEDANGRAMPAFELWFRRGLLRHGGTMTPDMVADAMVAAISLPRGYQYENLTVIPTAPRGELPRTFEAWGADVMSRYGAS